MKVEFVDDVVDCCDDGCVVIGCVVIDGCGVCDVGIKFGEKSLNSQADIVPV